MRLQQLLVISLLCGCAQGTGTGNPMNPEISPTETAQVLRVTCEKIMACHGLGSDELSNCQGFAYQQTTFAEFLGLNENPAPKLIDIAVREFKDELTPNTTAAENCRDQIAALACSNPAVQAGYDANEADPYEAASGLLSEDCKDIFRQ